MLDSGIRPKIGSEKAGRVARARPRFDDSARSATDVSLSPLPRCCPSFPHRMPPVAPLPLCCVVQRGFCWVVLSCSHLARDFDLSGETAAWCAKASGRKAPPAVHSADDQARASQVSGRAGRPSGGYLHRGARGNTVPNQGERTLGDAGSICHGLTCAPPHVCADHVGRRPHGACARRRDRPPRRLGRELLIPLIRACLSRDTHLYCPSQDDELRHEVLAALKEAKQRPTTFTVWETDVDEYPEDYDGPKPTIRGE